MCAFLWSLVSIDRAATRLADEREHVSFVCPCFFFFLMFCFFPCALVFHHALERFFMSCTNSLKAEAVDGVYVSCRRRRWSRLWASPRCDDDA